MLVWDGFALCFFWEVEVGLLSVVGCAVLTSWGRVSGGGLGALVGVGLVGR